MSIAPEDLPDRVEAWSTLDRLVWQDIDAERLNPSQAGRAARLGRRRRPARDRRRHGRTDALTGFPDDAPALPPGDRRRTSRRPRWTAPGRAPAGRHHPPGPVRPLTGRALATVGDRVVAAERCLRQRPVTLLGFDPTTSWIAEGDTGRRPVAPPPARPHRRPHGRRRQPARQRGLRQPAGALPSADRRPARAAGYILLIGPINYLVLRRLDRREWAWLTMPVLIVVFAVGAYGIGSLLRGSAVIVNEVAIVRGAPGATDGTGPGRTRHLLARSAAPTSSACPAGRCSRRRSAATCSAVASPGRSTSSRATRPGSATSPSDTGRCERSAPRRQ